MDNIKISDKEFLELKQIIFQKSGIHIDTDDINHIKNKLIDRLIYNNFKTFREYCNYLIKNSDELQIMINNITINETYFFRERKHFEFLVDIILPTVKYNTFRCWSAAGSNGAEAYSIAMKIDSTLSTYQNWEIITSDINSDVLEIAKNGIYPLKYSKRIPIEYLKKYCLKGQNEDEGFFKIDQKLKERISFRHINLLNILDNTLGEFDLILLRNIIIYFDDKEKSIIIHNVLKHLKKGGYLFMGHSESLYRITNKVVQIRPSIYQKL